MQKEIVQLAVNHHYNNWESKAYKKSALELFLYLFYLLIFSTYAVYTSGRNLETPYFLAEGVRRTFVDAELSGASMPFTKIATRDDWWTWVLGPLLHGTRSDSDYGTANSGSGGGGVLEWYTGSKLSRRHASDGAFVNSYGKVLGTIRLSQWRTTAESCAAAPQFAQELRHTGCFANARDESNADKGAFGPELSFEWQADTHVRPVAGHFGSYGDGAFVEELTVQNTTLARLEAETLRNVSWVDGATRAVMAELSVYSPSANSFVYARFLVEFPSEGTLAVVVSHIAPFTGFPVLYRAFALTERGAGGDDADENAYDDDDDLFFWKWPNSRGDIFELGSLGLLGGFVLVRFCLEVSKLHADFRHYFLSFFNVLDVVLLSGHACAFWLDVDISFGTHNSYDELDLGPDFSDSYTDLRPLSDRQMFRHCLLASLVVLAFVKFLEPLGNVFSSSYRLVLMIITMCSLLLSRMFYLFVVLFFAWSLARYTVLSDSEWGHRTVVASLISQYPDVLGEFQWQRPYQAHDDIHTTTLVALLRVSFTVVVVLVMLNLLISILSDEYDSVKKTVRMRYCRLQATLLYLEKNQERSGATEQEGILDSGASHESRCQWLAGKVAAKEEDQNPAVRAARERLEYRLLNLNYQIFGSGTILERMKRVGYLDAIEEWDDKWHTYWKPACDASSDGAEIGRNKRPGWRVPCGNQKSAAFVERPNSIDWHELDPPHRALNQIVTEIRKIDGRAKLAHQSTLMENDFVRKLTNISIRLRRLPNAPASRGAIPGHLEGTALASFRVVLGILEFVTTHPSEIDSQAIDPLALGVEMPRSEKWREALDEENPTSTLSKWMKARGHEELFDEIAKESKEPPERAREQAREVWEATHHKLGLSKISNHESLEGLIKTLIDTQLNNRDPELLKAVSDFIMRAPLFSRRSGGEDDGSAETSEADRAIGLRSGRRSEPWRRLVDELVETLEFSGDEMSGVSLERRMRNANAGDNSSTSVSTSLEQCLGVQSLEDIQLLLAVLSNLLAAGEIETAFIAPAKVSASKSARDINRAKSSSSSMISVGRRRPPSRRWRNPIALQVVSHCGQDRGFDRLHRLVSGTRRLYEWDIGTCERGERMIMSAARMIARHFLPELVGRLARGVGDRHECLRAVHTTLQIASDDGNAGSASGIPALLRRIPSNCEPEFETSAIDELLLLLRHPVDLKKTSDETCKESEESDADYQHSRRLAALTLREVMRGTRIGHPRAADDDNNEFVKLGLGSTSRETNVAVSLPYDLAERMVKDMFDVLQYEWKRIYSNKADKAVGSGVDGGALYPISFAIVGGSSTASVGNVGPQQGGARNVSSGGGGSHENIAEVVLDVYESLFQKWEPEAVGKTAHRSIAQIIDEHERSVCRQDPHRNEKSDDQNRDPPRRRLMPLNSSRKAIHPLEQP